MDKTKKIKELIESRFGNVKNFSRENNIPYTTVRSVLKRGVDNSGVNTIMKILKGLNMTMDDLDNLVNKQNEYTKEDLVEYKINKTKFLPIVGTVRAGEPILATENIESYFAMDNTVLDKNKDYFLLKVKGDSMDREFKEGSLLLIEKTTVLESGDIGVIIVNGDEATVKKVIIDDDFITLIPQSNNNEYLPKMININNKETIIVGKVKMAIKQY